MIARSLKVRNHLLIWVTFISINVFENYMYGGILYKGRENFVRTKNNNKKNGLLLSYHNF